jgi:hypothetical protein
MQIETWNILLNAVIGVLLLGYGIWLRSVVRRQLDSKDSTIESLGAAIKANEAEIARLHGETAPAIADSYKRMKEFAERIAAESNDLATRFKAIESDRQKIATDVSRERLSGHAEGFAAAASMLAKRIRELIRIPNPTNNITARELYGALMRFAQDVELHSSDLVNSLRQAQGKQIGQT